MYRYWIWLVLIGPALFFIYYWINTGIGGDEPAQRLPLPQEYRQAGEPVTTGGKTLLAAPGGRVAYTPALTLGNNRVVAEGGTVFLVLPLVVPDGFTPVSTQWYVVGGEGDTYGLLKVLPESPPEGAAAAGTGQGGRAVYLIFKVKKAAGDTFLVYTAGRDQAAWRLPGPGGAGH
ncbi:MAG: hypothetical protein ACOY40_14865 [Bacillota bacterium]